MVNNNAKNPSSLGIYLTGNISRLLNGSNSTTSKTTSTQGDKANVGSVSQVPSRTLNGSNSTTSNTTSTQAIRPTKDQLVNCLQKH